MMFPIIPVGIIAVFIMYILYLLFIKKDTKRIKPVLSVELAFMGLWTVIYSLWLH